jgi:hypothetical protein
LNGTALRGYPHKNHQKNFFLRLHSIEIGTFQTGFGSRTTHDVVRNGFIQQRQTSITLRSVSTNRGASFFIYPSIPAIFAQPLFAAASKTKSLPPPTPMRLRDDLTDAAACY